MNFDELRDYYFRQLQGRVRSVAAELTRVRYGPLRANETWHPPVNAYRCEACFLVVAELAGVDREDIHLTVEPRRVRLRGRRGLPEPGPADGPASRVLAMEIDDGAFEREIVLPADVDPERVNAEQREGLLWIRLPLAGEG